MRKKKATKPLVGIIMGSDTDLPTMLEAAKVLDFERVYAGIIAIGIAAFLFRFLLTFLEGRLFPWRKAASAFSGGAAAVPSASVHLKAAKHGA